MSFLGQIQFCYRHYPFLWLIWFGLLKISGEIFHLHVQYGFCIISEIGFDITSLYCPCDDVFAVELLWIYKTNGKAFCFYISWKNLCEIKINEIHCEDIGLISNSKQMERYSYFYTSFFISFGNFYFFCCCCSLSILFTFKNFLV